MNKTIAVSYVCNIMEMVMSLWETFYSASASGIFFFTSFTLPFLVASYDPYFIENLLFFRYQVCRVCHENMLVHRHRIVHNLCALDIHIESYVSNSHIGFDPDYECH